MMESRTAHPVVPAWAAVGGSALGFGNLTHYIARSLLEAGVFRPHLHPHVR